LAAGDATRRKGPTGPWKSALSLFAVTLATGLLCEVGVRWLLHETAFLSADDQEFWLARLRAAEQEPGRARDAQSDIQPDPKLGWRMRRHFRTAAVHHDSRGFRGAEARTTKLGMRVFCIGDSFTYGNGVADDATYAAQLAAITGAEVINAGVNAYGVDQAVLMWELEGARLSPDVVVLGYYAGDFFRSAIWLREAPKPHFAFDALSGRYVLNGPRAPSQSELRADWMRPRLWDVGRYFGRKLAARLGGIDLLSPQDKVRLSDYLIARLQASALGAGARPLIAFLDTDADSAEHLFVESSVMRACRRLKIECVSVAEAMRALPDRRAMFGHNHHFSERGHRFAAELIARALALTPPARRAAGDQGLPAAGTASDGSAD
jgi:hypothetical protein